MTCAPVRSRARSFQVSRRLALICRWSAKCGVVVQLATVRSAIARQVWLTGAVVAAAGGRRAAGAAGAAPASTTACTSAA